MGGNYKVGDKVYVHPGRPVVRFTHYIRATITETPSDEFGYRLRAFKEDLLGIYMYNVWDNDLLPRTDKTKKRLPDDN